MTVPQRGTPLTGREREVIRLVGDGLSNDEIADRLVLSPHTVRHHLRRATLRLGARNRANAVLLAVRTGYIPAVQP